MSRETDFGSKMVMPSRRSVPPFLDRIAIAWGPALTG